MSQTYIPVALRRLVSERSHDCCEYCLIPESSTFAPHWIDHVIAEKHGGRTVAENLANSCSQCNQRKGSDLSSIDPESGQIVPLFNPRKERWSVHFKLEGGSILPLTATGRATTKLLHLNSPDRIEERLELVAVGLLGQPE